MSVALPSSLAGTPYSEYAATSTNISRSMQVDANGHLQPAFNVSISYNRTDYLEDTAGNKIAIVQRQPWAPAAPTPGQPYSQDPYSGTINLSQAQIAALGAATTSTGILAAVAAQEDSLIQADLVARGILPAPTTTATTATTTTATTATTTTTAAS